MSVVPAALVDLALDALDKEVGCWRRIPMYPGVIRLMRFPLMSEEVIGPAELTAEAAQTVVYHDVSAKQADDLLMRFAMEKVLEEVIGAISVTQVEAP